MDEGNHSRKVAPSFFHFIVCKLVIFPDHLNLVLDAAPAVVHAFGCHSSDVFFLLVQTRNVTK